jgi:hypothetical protein
MKPMIDRTEFGSITIEGVTYDHDVIIRMTGEIKKRKKKLSKAVYGTSHMISIDEAKFIHKAGAERIIIGSGQYGTVRLSDEAVEYFDKKGCRVDLLPTPAAIELWNGSKGPGTGMFHVTC